MKYRQGNWRKYSSILLLYTTKHFTVQYNKIQHTTIHYTNTIQCSWQCTHYVHMYISEETLCACTCTLHVVWTTIVCMYIHAHVLYVHTCTKSLNHNCIVRTVARSSALHVQYRKRVRTIIHVHGTQNPAKFEGIW